MSGSPLAYRVYLVLGKLGLRGTASRVEDQPIGQQVDKVYFGLMLGNYSELAAFEEARGKLQSSQARMVFYDSLCVAGVLILVVLACSRYLEWQLEFLKAYDLMLRKHREGGEFEEVYRYSLQHYSWAQERGMCIEFKLLLTHLREFMWLTCNYPALDEDFPFRSQKEDEQLLTQGIELFEGKQDSSPFYHISESLIQYQQARDRHAQALAVSTHLTAKMQEELEAFERMYEQDEDNEALREAIEGLVFRLYENYICALRLCCKTRAPDTPECLQALTERIESLELRYNIKPELQL